MEGSVGRCTGSAGPVASVVVTASLGVLTRAITGQYTSKGSAFAVQPGVGTATGSKAFPKDGFPESLLQLQATAVPTSTPSVADLGLAGTALGLAVAVGVRGARPARVGRRHRVERNARGGARGDQTEPELKSDLGLDYKGLRNLLKARDFKAADAETRSLLIKMAGQAAEKRGWIFFSEIQGIPESDLMTVNGLWAHFSEERFGFAAQRKIWRRNRGRFDKFAEEVSWFTGKWKNRNWPDEFIYDVKAPIGHLPLTNCIRGAQVLRELLCHPAFEKKAAPSVSSKTSPVGMLAVQDCSVPYSQQRAWVGSSLSSLSGAVRQLGPVAAALSEAEVPAATPSEADVPVAAPSEADAAAATPSETDTPAVAARLEDIEEDNVINENGYILPEMPEGAQVFAFLIYDSNHKPQYLGFSKDLRNSLRTLLCRRPELCYHFKATHFMEVNEASMLELKNSWAEELGELPPGNADPRQKNFWESPVDGGAMSERAYKVVAEQKVKQVQQQLRDRGLKEPLEFNTDLIAKGKVDVVPSKLKIDDLLAEQENLTSNTVRVKRDFEGKPIEFDIFYAADVRSKGGWWIDVEVSAQKQKSTHRVIVGDDFMAAVGAEGPREVVEKAFVILLARKAARKTDGLITSEVFPINYFTATNMATFYPEFLSLFGMDPKMFDRDMAQWCFKQVHDYQQDEKRTISTGPMGGVFDPAALS